MHCNAQWDEDADDDPHPPGRAAIGAGGHRREDRDGAVHDADHAGGEREPTPGTQSYEGYETCFIDGMDGGSGDALAQHYPQNYSYRAWIWGKQQPKGRN